MAGKRGEKFLKCIPEFSFGFPGLAGLEFSASCNAGVFQSSGMCVHRYSLFI